MGYLWGFGLLQSGGGNSVFSVITKDGNLKLKNIVGLYLFTFYWYWYPLSNMIGLTLEPTYLAGVTESLNVPRGF
jgi:26S proteasome regulatory subunit N2